MRFLLKTFLAAIIATACSVSAFAAETRVVPANRASAIFFYYTVGTGNCYSGGKPDVHITHKPAHGSVTTAWKAFRMGNNAGRCAGKPVHGTLVVYQPAKGYRGPDKVSAVFRGGVSTDYFVREKEFSVDITVK